MSSIQHIPVAPVPRLALTREELAESLGVSDRTISHMQRSGLPHVRLGASDGRVVFPVAEVADWLAQRVQRNNATSSEEMS